MQNKIPLAFSAFRELLGTDHVEENPAAIHLAMQATFPTHDSVEGIIHPVNQEQVSSCLKIAQQYHIPLYPISRGKNWGYGSRVPITSGCILLSLAKLNRILQFDETLGYVRIEPGVSFEELNDFLKAHGGQYRVENPGSSAETSVIGNILERGLTADGERTHQVCAMKLLLPNGEWLETGFDNFPSAQSASLHPWGVGPSAEGLFFQSNLGIVMELTLWLQPIPAYTRQLLFSISSEESLIDTLDHIRQLKLNNQFRGNCALHTIPKVLSLASQYPYSETRNRTPLPEVLLSAATKSLGGIWLGEIAIHEQDSRILQIQEEIIWNALSTVTRQPQRETQPASAEDHSTGMLHAYWRKTEAMPLNPDPDRDRCGLLWHCPVLPLIGKTIAIVVLSAQKILLHHGFEPMISIQIMASRYAYLIISIVYDRDKPGEDDLALKCYEKLVEDTNQQGYYPYRLGIQSMEDFALMRKDRGFWQELKHLWDPNDILAPGRYILPKDKRI
ncbi:MAG: FAD-binding oxidoreductase [Bacteroidia bacterium]|nr:FAD-binding oxidoreductase [Bacteroidia bacterium]